MTSSTVRALKVAAFCLAVLAVVAFVAGLRLGWWDLQPGGTVFQSYVAPPLYVMFTLAALLSLRFTSAAAGLGAFALGVLTAFAADQIETRHAVIAVALFAVPVAAWSLVVAAETSRRPAIVRVVGIVAATVIGVVVGDEIYERYWGPTHPESELVALEDSPVEWVWSGAIRPTEAEIRAKPRGEYDSVRLAVAADPDLEEVTWIEPADEAGAVVGFRVGALEPATDYHYAVEVDGELDRVRSGTFTTFPQGASSYTVAVGACARVGSNGAVFDAIRETEPLLYLIIGDFHYGDNGVDDIEEYREVLDITLTEPAQAALYRTTPIAYVWDDHDYGLNDADGKSPSRPAAMAAFREFVPSYDLAGPQSAVFQAFTVGRVRYVMTDARSARNVEGDGKPGEVSMLGAEQKAWFKDEIVSASRTHELVVWVNPVPWIAEAREGADHWGGFADERRELADHIAENDVDNLLMVSGDAHMVAIDDGTNTDYSTEQAGGFPLLHSAALDRPGGVKGGPYSEGAFPGGGQFATIDVADDGEKITVTLTGSTWEGETLIEHRFTTGDEATPS